MNARKLVVIISYALNVVLIFGIVGILIYHQRSMQNILNKEGKDSSAIVTSGTGVLGVNNTQDSKINEGGVEQLEVKVETLRYQLEAAEEELDMAREDMAGYLSRPVEEWKEVIALEKKRRENSVLMEAERRRIKNNIVNIKQELFELLDLPDEKLQNFISLMVDNEMEIDFLLTCLGSDAPSKEDREMYGQQYEDQQAEYKKQVAELLGKDNYEIYNTYEDMSLEISCVNGFVNLSNEKAQELIDAMYKARKDVEAKYPGFDAHNYDQKEGLIEVADAYIECARRILPESELVEFEAVMNEQKEELRFYIQNVRNDNDES